MHAAELTDCFLAGLLESVAAKQLTVSEPLIFPVQQYPAYSGLHLLKFLHERLSAKRPDDWQQSPLVFIGFSAGVVGAIAAAIAWQQLGGQVKALMALDGWGVPLGGEFPIHRLSHDAFTHWSSALLGAGGDSFYADPAVEHLELWRSPQTTRGWWVNAEVAQSTTPTTAANFLTGLLQRYHELH